MSKYIRTKDGIFDCNNVSIPPRTSKHLEIEKQANTIEDLIQIGDIVFYWQQYDDKEHCCLITCDFELNAMKYGVITKLFIPVGNDYKCVAKAEPSYHLIKGRRYLVNKGELELL